MVLREKGNNPPTPSIKVTHSLSTQLSAQLFGVEQFGEIAIPGGVPQNRYHSHRFVAGVGAIVSHLDDFVTIALPLAQYLLARVGSFLPLSSQKVAFPLSELPSPAGSKFAHASVYPRDYVILPGA
jgi:hypothetical protein